MILVLEVRGAQASALGASYRRQFGPEGGVIGRASTCDWVLPHAKVSARHAFVSFADGVFYLEDKSTNGVFVNQTRERLVRGLPHALRSGDRIFIDPYDIKVSVAADESAAVSRAGAAWDLDPFGSAGSTPKSVTDPFAVDPFAATPTPSHGLRRDLGVSREASEDRELDPLKLIDGPQPVAPPRRRPQARDLDAASPIAAHYRPPAVRTPPSPPPAPLAAPLEIPEDYNPLDDSGVVFAPPPAPQPSVIAEPFPQPSVIAERFPQPSVIAEPLPQPSVTAEPPPQPTVEPLPPTDWEPPAAPPQADPEDESVVWEVASAGTEPAVESVPEELTEPEAPDVLPSAPGPAPLVVAAAAAVPVVPPSVLPAASPTPRPDVRSRGDLAGVLAGAGIEGVEVTEELARDFGRILQVVVSGVMDVLRSRQQIKDEFRMRMTQFRPADNNPLKFSANVEDALHNLLVKRNAAYLRPVEAFEDAFEDVRGHQLAMLAGMRVAFESMLAEFNPERLQEQFDRQLKKGSLLTVPAKLRYWELYRDYCEKLQKDTESTFRKLFGEVFAEAYEEQLNRLKAERIARRRATEPES